MKMHLFLDIGGNKTRLAISKDGVRLSKPVVFRTPAKFKDWLSELKTTIVQFTPRQRVKKTIVGIRGVLNIEKTSIKDGILRDWNNRPIKKEIEKITRSPASLENDAALVGLGEAVYGPGKSGKIVVYLTVSTGVGGVRIVNGRIDVASYNFEPGLQIIDYKTKTNLEDLISGTAVSKKYHKKPYEILELKFWDKIAQILAVGINNTIVHWSPDTIILGGSMMKKVGIKIPRVKHHLSKILKAYPTLPEIYKATLGDFGGLYGGLALVKKSKLI